MKLKTVTVTEPSDVVGFFDTLAPHYGDCHGQAERQLAYRLRVISSLLEPCNHGRLLEIGCGTGWHLLGLADRFAEAIGTDLSAAMIEQAQRLVSNHPSTSRIRFVADPAERLAAIPEASVDAVFCVGAFEHMPEKLTVLRRVNHALKAGGVFVCLTPDGAHPWYRWIGPRLGLATRHLSSDAFVDARDLRQLATAAGLQVERSEAWTFIPRGDMPLPLGWLLRGLATLTEGLGIDRWRGGVACRAVKPAV